MHGHTMQGFYVNLDYHNIAPDAVMDNYTVCSAYLLSDRSCSWRPNLRDTCTFRSAPQSDAVSQYSLWLFQTVGWERLCMLRSRLAADLWTCCSSQNDIGDSGVNVDQQQGGGSCEEFHVGLAVQLFISDWVDLLTDVLAAVPEARGKLLLDMINEPDGYGFTW